MISSLFFVGLKKPGVEVIPRVLLVGFPLEEPGKKGGGLVPLFDLDKGGGGLVSLFDIDTPGSGDGVTGF